MRGEGAKMLDAEKSGAGSQRKKKTNSSKN
jgi:hypothetical protein